MSLAEIRRLNRENGKRLKEMRKHLNEIAKLLGQTSRPSPKRKRRKVKAKK